MNKTFITFLHIRKEKWFQRCRTTRRGDAALSVLAEYDNNNNIIITITQYNNARAPVCMIYTVLLYISVSVRDRILRRPLCSPIVIKEISVAFFSWVMRDRRSHYNNLGGCGGHFFHSSQLGACYYIVVIVMSCNRRRRRRLSSIFFHSFSMRLVQYNNVIKYERRAAHIIYFITLLL
jgi:hypothetical protein